MASQPEGKVDKGNWPEIKKEKNRFILRVELARF